MSFSLNIIEPKKYLNNLVSFLKEPGNSQKILDGFKVHMWATIEFFNLNKSSELKKNFHLTAIGSAIGFIPARLFSQGLANFLGLETLRHGTNPISCVSIHLRGGLPSKGGSIFGGDYGNGYESQNKDRFYCAHIVDLSQPSHLNNNLMISSANSIINKIFGSVSKNNFIERICRSSLNAVATSFLPKIYAKFSIENGGVADFDSLFYALLTPTIKFHVPREKIDKDFEIDNSYPVGFAYSTKKWMAPIHSGLPGIIWNSITYKTPIRMINNPQKVCTGLAQMAVSLSLAALVYHRYLPLFRNHHGAILIGIVAAVI